MSTIHVSKFENDPPILNVREIAYAARDLVKQGRLHAANVEPLIAAIVGDTAILACLVAGAYKVDVRVWDDIESNEACFTGGTDEALQKLSDYEGLL
jgi:hypothetical protein